jgi:hypothetical protein
MLLGSRPAYVPDDKSSENVVLMYEAANKECLEVSVYKALLSVSKGLEDALFATRPSMVHQIVRRHYRISPTFMSSPLVDKLYFMVFFFFFFFLTCRSSESDHSQPRVRALALGLKCEVRHRAY